MNGSALPPKANVRLASRWPNRLPAQTVRAILEKPLPLMSTEGGAPRSAPLASIIIPTFNGLVFTKLCLISLLEGLCQSQTEVIIIDNDSKDGTRRLVEEAARLPAVKVILNSSNRGFATAANQGLEMARGEHLVLLNSDTLVPPGWLPTLLSHFRRDSQLGLIGPCTNRCGNEAEVEASYADYREFLRFAERRRTSCAGRILQLSMLSMFCLAMPRQVFQGIGFLDERFQVGMFEDDDYSLRARRCGYSLACADDCFIHHYGQASFGESGGADRYDRLLRENRSRFEAKWGIEWTPHRGREEHAYRVLRARLCRLAQRNLSRGATALVVSKGDDQLVSMLGGGFEHFPQSETGGYAGCYPADGLQAAAHLRRLSSRGAEYILFPRTARWWLDYYPELGESLELVEEEASTGALYRIRRP